MDPGRALDLAADIALAPLLEGATSAAANAHLAHARLLVDGIVLEAVLPRPVDLCRDEVQARSGAAATAVDGRFFTRLDQAEHVLDISLVEELLELFDVASTLRPVHWK